MRGWLIPAAILALTPKCALCLLAYAGLGTWLGLGGPELCGGPAGASGPWLIAMISAGVVYGVGHILRSRHRV
ncbi:MAG: hypothetical protein ABI273_09405 [Lacunisphaera sp.]